MAKVAKETPAQRARRFNVGTYDDGKTEWRAGDVVWYKPIRSRKWRQGKVTYASRRQERGPRGRYYDFVRVDWVIARDIRREPPEMPTRGYAATPPPPATEKDGD